MSELIAKGYLLRKFLGIDISGKRIKIIMRGKMKRVVFVIGIALFILAIILCIQARTAYPKPIYEPIYPDDPRYTGEVIEWFDRASGWEVQWALVYDPNNPTWVDIFQGDTSFFIFVGLFVLCSLSRPLRKAK